MLCRITPALSEKAKTAMKQKIREWKIQLKVNLTLKDIGNMINKVVQGWISYYTHYYKSEFYEVLRYINQCPFKWVRRSYKKKKYEEQSRALAWYNSQKRQELVCTLEIWNITICWRRSRMS